MKYKYLRFLSANARYIIIYLLLVSPAAQPERERRGAAHQSRAEQQCQRIPAPARRRERNQRLVPDRQRVRTIAVRF